VKDLLSNVGSGGAAAGPAAGGAAAAAGGAAEEAKEEEKVEGQYSQFLGFRNQLFALALVGANKLLQRRRSPTRTWASVSSTKRFTTLARRGFDCSGSLCTFKACMDLLRRRIAFTTTGMEAMISGVLVHRRSFKREMKIRV